MVIRVWRVVERLPAAFAVLISAAILAGPAGVDAQLQVTPLNPPTLTPTDLVNKLLGPGIMVSNVTYTGSNAAAGIFSGGTGIIGFEDGILLSSGKVADVVGPNNGDGTTTNFGTPGDPDLATLVPGFPTFDAAVLEFDFIPEGNRVIFRYVFTSEEYNEYANGAFNNVFGFFVNGVNKALLPDGVTPVAINNVNGGNPLGSDPHNPSLYINNDCDDGPCSINIQADGLTVVLTLRATVNPGVANHMKLAISDAGDSVLDSWVFIRAESITVPKPGDPVTNPINPGPVPLEADGGFCPNAGLPCAATFPGNVGGIPSPAAFEWKGFVPLAFVPGVNGAVVTVLDDHNARSFVYTGVDSEGAGELNLYLMYDFLDRIEPFGPNDRPSVVFDVAAGRFAGRMVVTLNCSANTVSVSGFDNGVRFTNLDAAALGIEGACGFGKSPNQTSDAFFDEFVDPVDGLMRGFNVPHAMFELEVPLTQNLGGDPRPGGGVYDPAPAFWSASAPPGPVVLSQNSVSINIFNGSNTVTPLGPSGPCPCLNCASSTLALNKGSLNLDPREDKDKIALQGAFAPPVGPIIDPPVDGVTLKLSDADGVIACVMIPPNSQGWKTSTGPKWTFKDKGTGSLGDPDTNEALNISFNRRTGQFDVKVTITRDDLVDPDAGEITTSLAIGTHAFTSTDLWRSVSKGKKLVTP